MLLVLLGAKCPLSSIWFLHELSTFRKPRQRCWWYHPHCYECYFVEINWSEWAKWTCYLL